MGLFKAGERRRRRRRSARASVRSIAVGERRRRRRSARALFKGLAEKKRKHVKKARKARRSRKGKKHTKYGMVRSHKRRTHERKRRHRRSRRSREAVRTYGLSERRRRRHRRARTSVKPVVAGERRRRRHRRARTSVKPVLAGERRRRRSHRRGRRVRQVTTMARFARPTFSRVAERKRRRRGARQTGLMGNVSRFVNGSFATYAKKAGVATVGILGGRLLSGLLGRLGASAGLFNNATVNQYSGVITSGVAGGLTYWLTGLKIMPAMVKDNRGLITLGAYLHFVEEILNVAQGWGVLPKSGVMAGALYGYPLGQQALGAVQPNGMGYCSYGCGVPADTMANTIAQPCIGANGQPGTENVYQQSLYGMGGNAQAPAHNHTGLGYCSYGCSVPSAPAGWVPDTCAPGNNWATTSVIIPPTTSTPAPGNPVIPGGYTVNPVAGIGGAAFEQAGFAGSNPAVNDLLVGRANNIQSVLAGAGIPVQ